MIKARFEYGGDKDLLVFGLREQEIEKLLAGEVLVFSGDTLNPNVTEDPTMNACLQLVLVAADDQASLHAHVQAALGLTIGTS